MTGYLAINSQGKGSRKTPRVFYGQADRKEGVGSVTSALTVSKCENFDFFFIEIGFFDTQNTFYLIVEGLKNTFFMPLSWLSK